MFNFFKNLFKSQPIENMDIDSIIDRASLFLEPQLNMMKELDGNKFGFITMESVVYMLNVARALGGRAIEDEEFVSFLVGVLGEDYRPMAEYKFQTFKNPRFDHDWFSNAVKVTKKIVELDIKKGNFDRNSFLVAIAVDQSEWGKKVASTE